jgi:ComF family protein
MVRRLTDAVLAVLLAPHCLTCGASLEAPLAGPVCSACWHAVLPIPPPSCLVCGDALPSWRILDLTTSCCARCRRQPPAFTCARAAGAYEGVLRQLIHGLKFEGRRTLAAPLGEMMRVRGAEALRGADLVVPVPLHWRRQHARGFNQAEELARHLGVPVVRALRRVRPTSPQSGLSATDRRHNLRGALAPSRRKWLRLGRHEPEIRGACVVVVDDVSTTGATLDACARVLRDAGAREVRALTAARALSRGPNV